MIFIPTRFPFLRVQVKKHSIDVNTFEDAIPFPKKTFPIHLFHFPCVSVWISRQLGRFADGEIYALGQLDAHSFIVITEVIDKVTFKEPISVTHFYTDGKCAFLLTKDYAYPIANCDHSHRDLDRAKNLVRLDLKAHPDIDIMANREWFSDSNVLDPITNVTLEHVFPYRHKVWISRTLPDPKRYIGPSQDLARPIYLYRDNALELVPRIAYEDSFGEWKFIVSLEPQNKNSRCSVQWSIGEKQGTWLTHMVHIKRSPDFWIISLFSKRDHRNWFMITRRHGYKLPHTLNALYFEDGVGYFESARRLDHYVHKIEIDDEHVRLLRYPHQPPTETYPDQTNDRPLKILTLKEWV